MKLDVGSVSELRTQPLGRLAADYGEGRPRLGGAHSWKDLVEQQAHRVQVPPPVETAEEEDSAGVAGDRFVRREVTGIDAVVDDVDGMSAEVSLDPFCVLAAH